MRAIVGACISGALTLTACGGDAKPHADGRTVVKTSKVDAETPEESPEAFSRRVHTEALTELRKLVDAYLVRTQPVLHATALGKPLALPYAPGPEDEEIRAQLDTIEKRIGEIRRPALSVVDGRRHDAWLLMAQRDTWQRGRGGPHTDDALAYLVSVADLIREARTRLLVSDACEGCARALTELPAGLQRARELLASANPANVEMAASRAEALADELDGLRPLFFLEQRGALDEALAGLRTHASELRRLEFADDEPRPWTTARATRRDGKLIPRPPAWGPDYLREVFEHEEGYSREPGVLRDEAQAKLERFRKMREELVRRHPAQANRGTMGPVDLARCDGLWGPMKAFATTKGGFSPRLSCERVVTWLEGQSMDDHALAARLIREGLVEATMHESVRSRGGLLAAIGGRWTRESAREFRAVMFAFPLARQPVGEAALLSLEHRICLATVGLEVHAGIDDDRLDGWLGEWCPEQSPAAWKAEAFADPRGAFVGIPALVMGNTPAEMVPVVEYSWAMYGVSIELARPDNVPGAQSPNAAGKVNMRVEEIDPASF